MRLPLEVLRPMLERWNAGVQRAMNHYFWHPLGDERCTRECIDRGCPTGLREQERRRRYYREYRQQRRTEGRDK